MERLIRQLEKHPYYTVRKSGDHPVIVFDDHRFVVPVLWLARDLGLLPAGAGLVRFDGHFDAADLREGTVAAFARIKTFDEAFAFARDSLGPIDDDWQSLVLESGLVGRTVIFCGRDPKTVSRYSSRMTVFKNFQHNTFLNDAGRPESVFLDIDCDYFTYLWRGQLWPWTNELYEQEFSRGAVEIMRGMIQRSPLITICREPDFCGGRDNAEKILNDLWGLFFNPDLSREKSARRVA